MRIILLLLLLVFLAQMAGRIDPRLAPIPAALADDDDDGGSDDDDDDGPGRSSRDDDDDDGPGRVNRPARQAERRPAVPPPEYRAEIIVQGLAAADLARLLAMGFRVIETQELPARGGPLRRLAVPEGLDLQVARDLVRALPSGSTADLNHFYRAGQAGGCSGPHCPAFEQVGWQPASVGACAAVQPPWRVRIGMVDTGINAGHDSLGGADLELHRLESASATPSAAQQHGTAVAALLVGRAESRTPGLIPDLSLIAVDVFEQSGGDERTDAFGLIRALALLQASGVRVINLSLAGPENAALSQSLGGLADAGIVLVAAAGNGGPRAAPLWPAAHPQVIAVTAIDRTGAVYRRAG